LIAVAQTCSAARRRVGLRALAGEEGAEAVADLALALLDALHPGAGVVAVLRQQVALGQDEEDRQAGHLGAGAAAGLHRGEELRELGEDGLDLRRRRRGVDDEDDGVGLDHLVRQRALGLAVVQRLGVVQDLVGHLAVAVQQHGLDHLRGRVGIDLGVVADGVRHHLQGRAAGRLVVEVPAQLVQALRAVLQLAAEQGLLGVGGVAQRAQKRRLAGGGQAEQHQPQLVVADGGLGGRRGGWRRAHGVTPGGRSGSSRRT
jgi:hypothetical protein